MKKILYILLFITNCVNSQVVIDNYAYSIPVAPDNLYANNGAAATDDDGNSIGNWTATNAGVQISSVASTDTDNYALSFVKSDAGNATDATLSLYSPFFEVGVEYTATIRTRRTSGTGTIQGWSGVNSTAHNYPYSGTSWITGTSTFRPLGQTITLKVDLGSTIGSTIEISHIHIEETPAVSGTELYTESSAIVLPSAGTETATLGSWIASSGTIDINTTLVDTGTRSFERSPSFNGHSGFMYLRSPDATNGETYTVSFRYYLDLTSASGVNVFVEGFDSSQSNTSLTTEDSWQTFTVTGTGTTSQFADVEITFTGTTTTSDRIIIDSFSIIEHD